MLLGNARPIDPSVIAGSGSRQSTACDWARTWVRNSIDASVTSISGPKNTMFLAVGCCIRSCSCGEPIDVAGKPARGCNRECRKRTVRVCPEYLAGRPGTKTGPSVLVTAAFAGLRGQEPHLSPWLEHFPAKWPRFTVENASVTKTRAGPIEWKRLAPAFARSLSEVRDGSVELADDHRMASERTSGRSFASSARSTTKS